MNYEETLDAMVSAATTAAGAQWQALKSFGRTELARLAEGALWIEADLIADLATAALQTDDALKKDLTAKAIKRAELAFESLEIASRGLVTLAKAAAKHAAQDALNAALQVLRAAVNKSIGFGLL